MANDPIQNTTPRHLSNKVNMVLRHRHVWLPMELDYRGLYYLLKFSQIWQILTVQIDNDPQHSAKATQKLLEARKLNILKRPSQSVLTIILISISLLVFPTSCGLYLYFAPYSYPSTLTSLAVPTAANHPHSMMTLLGWYWTRDEQCLVSSRNEA